MKLSKIAALFMVPVLALCLVACSAPGGNASESASSDPKIAEITGGKSLESNIQLVFNNAAVGTEIAKEYFK